MESEPIPMWSDRQRKRLGIEKNLLEDYFPARTNWTNSTNATKTKVDIALNTNDKTEYILRIHLTQDFPNACPMLTVVSPMLKSRKGDRFPESSTEFHTLQNIEGYPTVCHFHPESWTQENTLYQVFMKGRLWLEAYSLYHSTGKIMDTFLKEFDSAPEPEVVPAEKKRSKSRLRSILRRR
ncbi:Hypothetical predicted protein [Paramuricea clavata]|uniref:Uncharacterized protein n=1 Tax=Paramuricea clavata TaxID=317549 RepID=A0A7D9H8L5_PARCT|nr:Hypothetical predicted protein [Paramuricea clavata]